VKMSSGMFGIRFLCGLDSSRLAVHVGGFPANHNAPLRESAI